MSQSTRPQIEQTFRRFVLAMKAEDYDAFEAVHSLKRMRPVSREQFHANASIARAQNLSYRIEKIELDKDEREATVHFAVLSPKEPGRVHRDRLVLVPELGEWRILRS